MLRDDEAFPVHGRFEVMDGNNLDGEGGDAAVQHANDDFDDVFGSAPPSPTSTSFDRDNGNIEYSDIPRLKEKHETEGYRDGVTKGKGESVQVGFDEGYGLGAVLGLKIGRILGLLEGIYNAVKMGEGKEWEGEKGRIEAVLGEAKRELRTERVFDKEWWGEDGVWRFEVPGEGEGEVVFEDVARAHPLVRKWDEAVEEEVRRWGLDLGVMDGEQDTDEVDTKTILGRKDAVATKEVASETIAAGPGKIMGVSKADLNW